MLLARRSPDSDDERRKFRAEAASLLQTPDTLRYSDYERLLRKENAEYLGRMQSILTAPRRGAIKCSDAPGELLDYLFIGNMREARNPRMLKRLKITHVLNCAANPGEGPERCFPYDEELTGVTSYEEFPARDNDGYPILSHFNRAKKFIDDARDTGGRALVHCELGVNRSGAICIAYLMVELEITLLQALRRIKIERPVVLSNDGFKKQLIEFARDRELLHKKGSAYI